MLWNIQKNDIYVTVIDKVCQQGEFDIVMNFYNKKQKKERNSPIWVITWYIFGNSINDRNKEVK